MKYWKTLITLLWITLFPILSIGAQYDNNTFHTVNSPDFNFQAKAVEGQVKMSWDAFTQDKEYGFSYYKVIRSFDKNNPYYPEDGYITYISDINTTSYIDYDIYAKKAYYRVCAIAYDKGKYRFCSNVVSITKNDTPLEIKKIQTLKKEPNKDSFWWDNLNKKNQIKLDNLFNKYKNKIEKNFSTDEEKEKIINVVIEELNKYQVSEKQKIYVHYLINKFKDYKNNLSEWIWEIDFLIDNLLEK